MQKKYFIKIFMCILIVFILVLNNNGLMVYAGSSHQAELTDGGGTSTDPTVNPGYYKPTQDFDEEKIQEKAKIILGYINRIGIVASVIILVIIGIKYILGSVEEKAEYKKTMIYYILGAFLLFSSTTIPNIIYNLMT